jgi:hypothetical protein
LAQAKLNALYPEIRAATCGIVFFGTPHQAGDSFSLTDIVARITQVMTGEPKSDLIESLKRNQSFGDAIFREFRESDDDYFIVNCFETLPVHGAGIVSVCSRPLE